MKFIFHLLFLITFSINAQNNEDLSLGESEASSILVMAENNTLSYYLHGSKKNFTTLRVFDMQGKELMNRTIEGKEGDLPLQKQTAGVYLVSFTTDKNETISKKLILK